MIGSRQLNYQKTHKNIFVKEKTKSSEIEDSVEKFYCQRWNLVTETSLCRTRFKLGGKKKKKWGRSSKARTLHISVSHIKKGRVFECCWLAGDELVRQAWAGCKHGAHLCISATNCPLPPMLGDQMEIPTSQQVRWPGQGLSISHC